MSAQVINAADRFRKQTPTNYAGLEISRKRQSAHCRLMQDLGISWPHRCSVLVDKGGQHIEVPIMKGKACIFCGLTEQAPQS